MITEDIVQKVFNETIYPNLKEYIENNSMYELLVTKTKPEISGEIPFPIITIKLLPNTSTYNNLSYSDETFLFGIEIDINSKEKTVSGRKISKRTICEELTSLIVKFFKTNLKMTVYIEPNAVSTDSTIHRAIIRVTGKLDTKYGLDKLVIYPK